MMVLALCIFPGTSFAKQQGDSPEIEALRKHVEQIAFKLRDQMSRPDKLRNVHVQKGPDINAFADNKGDITIFTGMIDFVRNEDELATVIGHELAHLSAQHIKRSIGTSILATVAQEAIGGTLGNLAGSALFTKQSRKHEREADRLGMLYMWRAGYDPRLIWKFWTDMDKQMKAGNSKIEKFLSTHPVHSERIENFKVLLVRYCKEFPELNYCPGIMGNEDLIRTFNEFEAR